MKTIYQTKGYTNRGAYLKSVAAEYDVPLRVVATIAEVLGPDEDFDGLLCAIEDYDAGADCFELLD